MCGLKLHVISSVQHHEVTPHVGVWIETDVTICSYTRLFVTPHVGVWIETLLCVVLHLLSRVTPHVGVWIETKNYTLTTIM